MQVKAEALVTMRELYTRETELDVTPKDLPSTAEQVDLVVEE